MVISQKDGAIPGLHLATAGLYLATGAEAAAGPPTTPRSPGTRSPIIDLRWAPLLLAPLAGAVHVARALRPGPETRRATRVVDGIVLGAAAAGAATGLARLLGTTRRMGGPRLARRGVSPLLLGVLAPLAFGATALLGRVLDHVEHEDAAAHRRPERRPRFAERLVPKRRARVNRIVIRA